MSFLGNVGKFLGNIFGGNDDEEKKKRQQQQEAQQSQKSSNVSQNIAKPQNQNQSVQAQPSQQPDNGLNLVLPGQTRGTPAGFPTLLKKAQPADTRSQGQKGIDALAAQNLPKAIDEEKSRTSLASRLVTDRDWAKRAELTARNRAVQTYQEQNGYTQQPEVQQTLQKNRQTSDALVKESADATSRLNTVQKGATKAAQVAQYVPVTGSVVNLGLAGTERLAKAAGKQDLAKNISDQRTQNEFGMTPEQLAALDDKTKAKLQNIRNIGYGLAPLDALGVTGLVKSEGTAAVKNAALQAIKTGAVDAAAKTALKTEGVQAAKTFGKGAALGTGLTVAGQEYIGGQVDPLEAAKNGALIGGTGLLFGGSGLRKAQKAPGEVAPGLRSANPNQEADAANAIAAQMAQENAIADARMQMMADSPTTGRMRTADNTNVPGIPAKAPKGSESFVSPREQAAQTQGAVAAESIAGDRTPAFQRQAAQQPEVQQTASGLVDTPAFQRQGKELPSQSIEAINDDLRTNAQTVTSDPANAGAVGESFRATGSQNPLSLIMHHLSNNPDKGAVRAMVQQLIPEADGNTLNRAVNSITGADNVADVSQALTEAATRARRGDSLGRVSDAPAPIPTPPATVPTPDVPRPPEVPTPEPTVSQLAGDNTRPEAQLQTAIEEAHNAGDDVKAAELINQMPPEMQPPMRSALNIPDPAAEQRQVYQEASQSNIPVVQQTANELLNKVPEPAPAPQAPAAPNTHDALVKQLGPDASSRKGEYATRDVLNLDELKQKATGVIANMSDEELVNSFATAGPDTLVHDPQSFGLARAALDRLYAMTDNPIAEQQVTNILDGMAKYTSKNAQGLRIVQEEFDNMPIPMKVRYLIKKIDAANVGTKNYEPLARDPAKAAELEAALSSKLQAGQDIAERVAKIESQLETIAEAAKNGEKVDTNIRGLTKVLNTERRNLATTNGELVKYFQDLVPGRTTAQKALVDFPKRMMLSSFTGRVNDILSTTANIANLQTQNFTQGLLSKAINLVKPGTVTDTWRGGGRLFTGAAEGLKKTVGELRGKQYVDNVEKSLRGNEDLRSGLQKARGPVGRTIQAATEMATNLSKGVGDQRLYQLSIQEGRKAGLKGQSLRQYAEARAAVPSRQMLDTANQLHMEVNNLNENPISRALNRVSSGIEGKSAIGGLLKNQIMPFTSWLGGNIWNSVTDKNVVASAIKFGNDALRGNPEGAVRNLSRTINGAVEAYALGYVLSKSGVLTNENAEGYNDGGAYFHIGDRYIPVGFLGFWAPNIILGNAAYTGLEANEGKNPAAVIAEKIAGNSWNSLNVSGAIGVDTNLSRAYTAATRPGGNWQDAAAVASGGAAGQFLPALGSDANAVINNGMKLGGATIIPDSLNPTHEASNTKVENPNSASGHARDYTKSTIANLENRIPILSQTLPRKANVAAPDLVDRTTRGDRDTQGSNAAKATAKNQADQSADWKKRDVPNFRDKGFDDAVEARVQRGEYDKAIEAKQAKLDDQKKNKDIPDSKNKSLQDDIKQYQVLKAGNFDSAIRDTYKSTSVSEWRDLGDPESDTYDPKAYQKLFDYDTALSKAGISGSSLDKSGNKFTAKKPAKGKGGGSSSANTTAKSNTIGSMPDLGKVSFGDLAPQKAGSIKIPTIQQIRSSDLVKKRKITVTR